ncbi:RidA family protein [Mesorhizobium abyssinicae]|uniref:RidA family protein n=1 Tax=Mesorhizobium abyssinicae TaxID=1209958 RepID=UPI0033971DAF
MSTAGAAKPVPQGNYVAARRCGSLVFTAGMTPRRNGILTMVGPIQPGTPPEAYRDPVVLACANALAAARSVLADSESIAAIITLTVYTAAQPGFSAHSAIADFASRFLQDELGQAGIGARTAVGVATLPGNAPVEIQLVAVVA